ncbi:MAG: BON domain-containing protein [Magnetococcales bacterium]|nr:BON domain-containing protein [Magnetococcales bacterium]
MNRFSRPLLPSLLLLAAPLVLTGCETAAVVAGGAAASALGERRSTANYLEDKWLAMKLRKAYLDSAKISAPNINVSVYNGKVLLTGAAASEGEIDEAIRLAKAARGVVEVRNELKVQHETAAELAEDMLVANKVKLKLLADRDVRGVDYHVEAVKGIVYLSGSAHTVEERDAAVKLASEVGGVVQVVSYIDVDDKSFPVNPEARQDLPPAPLGKKRTASDMLEDNWVALKIRTAYVQNDKVQVGNINVSVYRGQVLLTGTAASEEEIAEAIRLAKNVWGVADVVSELKVQHVSGAEVARDVWITSQVKVKLLADPVVNGLDLQVETTKGEVFLTGVSRTVQERDRAVRLAEEIEGVTKVTSLVEVDPEPVNFDP